MGTGAVSRYKLSRSQKTVTVQELVCGQMRVSGYMSHYKFVIGAGTNKNRDKLIDPTVRVTMRFLFYQNPEFQFYLVAIKRGFI